MPIPFLRSKLASPYVANTASMLLAQVPFRLTRIVTAIVLTRSLGAGELGLAAVAMTAYETIGVLSSNGLAARIVRAADDDVAEMATTAYWLSWLVYAAMALVQLCAAIGLSAYFDNGDLFIAIAGMSLIYLSTPLSVVQAALLQREGRLGVLAFGSSLQMTTDNVLCCGLALSGFGMWAILIPKLIVMPIWVVVIRRKQAWRNQHSFTVKRWRDFYEFGRHFLPVELLGAVRGNIDNVVIGSMLGVEALGIYYFAFNAGLGLSLSLITAAGEPVYGHLCKAAHRDNAELQARFVKSLKLLCLIVTPTIIVQAFLVPFYVPLVFGPSWVGSVPIVVLICLSALPTLNGCQLAFVASHQSGRSRFAVEYQLYGVADHRNSHRRALECDSGRNGNSDCQFRGHSGVFGVGHLQGIWRW